MVLVIIIAYRSISRRVDIRYTYSDHITTNANKRVNAIIRIGELTIPPSRQFS